VSPHCGYALPDPFNPFHYFPIPLYLPPPIFNSKRSGFILSNAHGIISALLYFIHSWPLMFVVVSSSSSEWSISLSMFCNTVWQVRLNLFKKSLFLPFDCRIALLDLVSMVGSHSLSVFSFYCSMFSWLLFVLKHQWLFFFFLIFIFLFNCAYIIWVISPPYPLSPSSLVHPPSLPGRISSALISNFVDEKT
jgi:hypothetical protein